MKRWVSRALTDMHISSWDVKFTKTLITVYPHCSLTRKVDVFQICWFLFWYFCSCQAWSVLLVTMDWEEIGPRVTGSQCAVWRQSRLLYTCHTVTSPHLSTEAPKHTFLVLLPPVTRLGPSLFYSLSLLSALLAMTNSPPTPQVQIKLSRKLLKLFSKLNLINPPTIFYKNVENVFLFFFGSPRLMLWMP